MIERWEIVTCANCGAHRLPPTDKPCAGCGARATRVVAVEPAGWRARHNAMRLLYFEQRDRAERAEAEVHYLATGEDER